MTRNERRTGGEANRRGIHRTAWLVAALAVAIYIGFFVLMGAR